MRDIQSLLIKSKVSAILISPNSLGDIRVRFLAKLLATVVLTMEPTGLSKPTNALGQDEVNLGVISALLSSNITKSCTLLKKTGVLLKWSEE